MDKMETFEKNTYSAEITFLRKDSTAPDLGGAAVEAWAVGAGPTIPLGASVLDGAAGKVRVFWPAETFSAGLYEVQLRASKGGKTETYAARLTVGRSI
uniref:hypothetical protein n=1 Tax=Roseovarius sp. BRH_c41 TaxID=1629709 RepID=UPI0005F120A0|nr:hypothetical protein [Roseovarius sp. BRH_c41]